MATYPASSRHASGRRASKRENLTSNRARRWTQFRYLLAVTDLSRQLSGFKMPIRTSYRQKTNTEQWVTTGGSGDARPRCACGPSGETRLPDIAHPYWASHRVRDTPAQKKNQNHPAVLRSSGTQAVAARQLGHLLIDWLVCWRRGVSKSSSIGLYLSVV